MKRVKKPIRANLQLPNSEPVITLSEVFCLLKEIKELQNLKIEISESANENIQIAVGETIYELL